MAEANLIEAGAEAAPARPAATVVLLRDGARGPEVLMLRRHAAIEFAGDMWVFPGGSIDAEDRSLPARRWDGIDPHALAPRFGDRPDTVLGFHVAAVRETFEESGILLARGADGPAPADARAADGGFHRWVQQAGLVLDLGCLTYLSRWITPTAMPKRFDACFFVTLAPCGQIADHDRLETTDRRWVTPAAALDAAASGSWRMMFPTLRTLERLADHRSAEAAVAEAAAQAGVPHVLPRVRRDAHGEVRILLPGDDEAPAEIGREERG